MSSLTGTERRWLAGAGAARVNPNELEARFGFERWKGLVQNILARRGGERERERRLRALSEVVLESNPRLGAATAIRFEAVNFPRGESCS